MTPEAADGGLLAYLQDGDVIHLDARAGTLEVLADEASLRARTPGATPPEAPGLGRELDAIFRRVVGAADHGASVLF
jgi:phosphogluconate dehydratase